MKEGKSAKALLTELAYFDARRAVRDGCSLFYKGTRVHLFTAIEKWLNPITNRGSSLNDQTLFLLLGNASAGKTVFFSEFCNRLMKDTDFDEEAATSSASVEIKDRRAPPFVAAHFFIYGDELSDNVKISLLSIASQLEKSISTFMLPKFKETEMVNVIDRWKIDKVFKTFISTPLKKASTAKSNVTLSQRGVIIALDAVDECKPVHKNELLTLLRNASNHLPEWVRIIASSRPGVDEWWKDGNAKVHKMEIESPGNKGDINLFIDNKLMEHFPDKFDSLHLLRRKLVTRSQGYLSYLSFLDVVLFSNPQADASLNSASVKDVELAQDEAPKGYRRQLIRLHEDILQPDIFLQVFAPLLIVQDPIPLNLWEMCLENKVPPNMFRHFVDVHASSVLYIQEGNARILNPLVSDWLATYMRKQYQDDPLNIGYRKLADVCLDRINSGKYTDFSCKWVVFCLCKLLRFDEVKRLLTDFNFLLVAVKNSLALLQQLEKYFIPNTELNTSSMFVIGVLRLGKSAIENDYREIASQILGRVPEDIDDPSLKSLRESSISFLDNFQTGWKPLQPTLELADTPLIRTLEGHSDVVSDVCLSPDGNKVASGSVDGTVRLWETLDGEQIEKLEKHKWPVNAVSFSKSGKLLASVSKGGEVILWNLRQPKKTKVLSNEHKGEIFCVAFSPKRTDKKSYLATGGIDGTVRVWNMLSSASKKKVFVYEDPSRSSISCVSFNSDGTRIIAGTEFGRLIIWDFEGENSEQVREIGEESHMSIITSLVISPVDCNILLSASRDGCVFLWNLETLSKVDTVMNDRTSSGEILDASFSADGDQIICAVGDVLHLWSKSAESPWSKHKEIQGHSEEVQAVFVGKKTMVSASADKTVKVWKVLNTEKDVRLIDNSLNLNEDELDASSDISDEDDNLFFLSTPLRTAKNSNKANENGDVGFKERFSDRAAAEDESDEMDSDDDEQFFLSTPAATSKTMSAAIRKKSESQKSNVNIAQAKVRKEITPQHSDWIVYIAISPDSRLAATASKDGSIGVWDTKSGKNLRFLPIRGSSDDMVTFVRFSPDSQKLVGIGKKVRIWAVRTGKLLSEVMPHKYNVVSAKFSTNGRFLCSVDVEGHSICADLSKSYDVMVGKLNELAWEEPDDVVLEVSSCHVGEPVLGEHNRAQSRDEFIGFTLDSEVNVNTLLAPDGLGAVVSQGSKIHILSKAK